MKTIKMVFMAMMACAAVALISMAGTFPMAMQQSKATDPQEQTTTQQPEIVPGISTESMTIDIIFQ
ncbi:MAG: hypothetical protein Q7T18_08265 [Sedimentisphaerales bacterium]|nr:hypothetical protein [Sedimentisphaerales bacterium]